MPLGNRHLAFTVHTPHCQHPPHEVFVWAPLPGWRRAGPADGPAPRLPSARRRGAAGEHYHPVLAIGAPVPRARSGREQPQDCTPLLCVTVPDLASQGVPCILVRPPRALPPSTLIPITPPARSARPESKLAKRPRRNRRAGQQGGLPIVERRGFVAPGLRRAPCPFASHRLMLR